MDFHSMIGKLRAIESLGNKQEYVAEEAPESAIAGKCNMTAEGKSCPVHGLEECWSAPMEESDAATLAGMLKNSGQIAEATMNVPGYSNADIQTWMRENYLTAEEVAGLSQQDLINSLQLWKLPNMGQSKANREELGFAVQSDRAGPQTGQSTPKINKPSSPDPFDQAGRTGTASLSDLANTASAMNSMSAKNNATPAPTPGGARPEEPAAGMPAAPAPTSFGAAFRAARKAAGGAGGVFMWKGKPYQTNIKGEPAMKWNSPKLKKVGSGWPTSESVGRKMKTSRVNEADYDANKTFPKGPSGQSTATGDAKTRYDAMLKSVTNPNGRTGADDIASIANAALDNADNAATAKSMGLTNIPRPQPRPDYMDPATAFDAPVTPIEKPETITVTPLTPTTANTTKYGIPNYDQNLADVKARRAKTAYPPADTSGGVTSDPTYVPKTAPGGARPERPATGMPAAPAPTSFKDAFRAARKAAGGAGGVFMWKGKPYQTNVKGEPSMKWNSPKLKKVGSGWPTSESTSRRMKTTRVNEAGGIYGGYSANNPTTKLPAVGARPEGPAADKPFTLGRFGNQAAVAAPKSVMPTIAARPEGPAAGMPAAPSSTAPTTSPRPQPRPDNLGTSAAPTSFKDAFRAARKAAGGAGGVFMWKGKPYQTNVKGETAKAWNSPDLKKVGSGWPTSESIKRRMKTTRVNEAESGGRTTVRPGFGNTPVGRLPAAKPSYGPGTAVPSGMPGAKPSYGPGTAAPGGMPGAKPSYGPGTAAPGGMPGAKSSYGPGTVRPGSMPAAPDFGMKGRGLAPNTPRIGGKSATITPPVPMPTFKNRPPATWNGKPLTPVPMPTVPGRGDTRMGAASTGKLPGMPANMGKPTGLSVEYNDEEWYQFTGADGRTRYVGSDSGLADKATRARLRAIMKPDPVQFNKNNSEEAQLALAQIANDTMGTGMSESVDRMRELAGLSEMVDDSDDQATVDDMAADMSADAVDEMVNHGHDDDMATDMTIEDLMRKYGVNDDDEDLDEDAPLVGMPFTSLGATNNGPEEWGMVVTGGTSTNNFNESKQLKEGFTINSNMVVTDGKATKSLTINATDADVDTLATMLRNAGMGGHMDVNNHSDVCDDCGMTMENADHDYGHDEKSEIGEPLDVEDYVWDGPHLNQRFGKTGDNTLMAERAITLFKNYSDQYSQMLEEADLDTSNAGFDSPLTANSRDEFDKDPFVDETPVDDGSHSPLSTVKRQDVMEKLRKLAKILETTHTLYRIKVLSEAATKQDADALSQAISNFQTKAGITVTGVLDADTSAKLDAALNSDATAYANDTAPADTSMSDENSAALDAQIAKRAAQNAYQSALNAPNQSAAKQAQNDLYARQMSDPESMGWSYAEPDTDDAGNPEMTTFPSMAAANAKVNYYQPGEEAMIAGQTYIRDIDNQNKKVWVPAN